MRKASRCTSCQTSFGPTCGALCSLMDAFRACLTSAGPRKQSRVRNDTADVLMANLGSSSPGDHLSRSQLWIPTIAAGQSNLMWALVPIVADDRLRTFLADSPTWSTYMGAGRTSIGVRYLPGGPVTFLVVTVTVALPCCFIRTRCSDHHVTLMRRAPALAVATNALTVESRSAPNLNLTAATHGLATRPCNITRPCHAIAWTGVYPDPTFLAPRTCPPRRAPFRIRRTLGDILLAARTK
jgi:hypothetical protein